jgi:hypothetical protein
VVLIGLLSSPVFAASTEQELKAMVARFEGIYCVTKPCVRGEAMVSSEDGWLKIWHPFVGTFRARLSEIGKSTTEYERAIFSSKRIETITSVDGNIATVVEIQTGKTWKRVEKKELIRHGEELTFRIERRSFRRSLRQYIYPSLHWIAESEKDVDLESKLFRVSYQTIPLYDFLGRFMPNMAAQAADADCDSELSSGS